MSDDFSLTIGLPDQWKAFGERNREFFDRLDNLRRVWDAVFNREWSSEYPIDRLVFAAGFLTVDDFLELLLVCGNSEATAAQKLLRPMFERVVTLAYLAKHPEEFDLYFDYYWVSQRKLATAIETTFQSGLLNPEAVNEIEEHYKQVKDKYKVTDCEKCGTTRLNFTWTPKDIISMTHEVGLKDFIVPAYYLPMQFTHPSVQGMLSRMTMQSEHFTFTERLDPTWSDRIFCAAHALMLHALAVQVNHFKLDESLFVSVEKDFCQIWKREKITLE